MQSLLVGNVAYTRLARQLAANEHRDDCTAMPYGINTVSLFAYIFLVMLPVKLAALNGGIFFRGMDFRGDTLRFQTGWYSLRTYTFTKTLVRRQRGDRYFCSKNWQVRWREGRPWKGAQSVLPLAARWTTGRAAWSCGTSRRFSPRCTRPTARQGRAPETRAPRPSSSSSLHTSSPYWVVCLKMPFFRLRSFLCVQRGPTRGSGCAAGFVAAIGFVVDTDTAHVVDLGTAFGVSVGKYIALSWFWALWVDVCEILPPSCWSPLSACPGCLFRLSSDLVVVSKLTDGRVVKIGLSINFVRFGWWILDAFSGNSIATSPLRLKKCSGSDNMIRATLKNANVNSNTEKQTAPSFRAIFECSQMLFWPHKLGVIFHLKSRVHSYDQNCF